MLSFVSVFATMTAMDFAWAEYTKHIAGKAPVRGAVWSVVIILASGYVTRSYVDDAWALLPAALGAFTGTFLSIYRSKGGKA